MPRWGGYADFQQFIEEAGLWDEAPCSRGRATCKYTIMLGLRLHGLFFWQDQSCRFSLVYLLRLF